MSHHDGVIADQFGGEFLVDLNAFAQALLSRHSGTADPATLVALQQFARTDLGVTKRRNAANDANVLDDTLAETFVVAKSGTFTAALSDFKRVFDCTGTWSLNLTAAATLGDGWWIAVKNSGVGVITIDPNAAELVDGAATLAIAAGQSCLVYCSGSAFKMIGVLGISQTDADARYAPIGMRGFLAGCTMSTAGASATMSIAAGQAADSTNAVLMSLAAIAKTTAAWAVGTAQGGLDASTIANSTWYHFYLIRRPDTGVTDVIFSTNATSPTLPANYTQYRRIGSGLTNGSAQWTSFTQDGDDFGWATPVSDVAATNPGAAAVSYALSVPLGVRVKANFQGVIKNLGTAANCFGYFSDLATADLTPSINLMDTALAEAVAGGVNAGGGRFSIYTNTSKQIRARVSYSDGSVGVLILTHGWTDTRGRNA